MKLLLLLVSFVSLFIMPNRAKAELVANTELLPLKKWAVFPFDVSDERLKTTADQAWWRVREKITEKKRYQVASRQFLMQRDVFQARKNLTPENVRFLCQHLEADVLVTGFSEARDFQINVYLAQTGKLFWSKKMGFHSSLRASDQLLSLSARMTDEFLSKIPYQGFILAQDDKKPEIFKADFGDHDGLKEKDDVVFLKTTLGDGTLNSTQVQPVTVGKIISVNKAEVQIEVTKEFIDVAKTAQLLALPKEKKIFAYEEKLAPELLPSGETAEKTEKTHSKNTVIFGGVFGFLGLLLLL